jgi:hypothetical protein
VTTYGIIEGTSKKEDFSSGKRQSNAMIWRVPPGDRSEALHGEFDLAKPGGTQLDAAPIRGLNAARRN